jgi:hypothetical protein
MTARKPSIRSITPIGILVRDATTYDQMAKGNR